MKKKILIPFIVIAAVTFACISNSLPSTPDPSGVETIVSSTLESLPPSVPTYQYENVSLSFPAEVGTGIAGAETDDVELPFINPSNGPMPQHIVLTINGYPLPRQARITVFKASDYASYADGTQQVVNALQTSQYQAGQPIPDALNLGPLSPQAAAVSSSNGRGLRFLTEILVAVEPVSNDQVFYYYQGLNAAGTYYITAVLPISANILTANGDPTSPLPANGVPFPDINAGADEFTNYYNAISDKLNNASPDVFQPSLQTLDAMIQSITVN